MFGMRWMPFRDVLFGGILVTIIFTVPKKNGIVLIQNSTLELFVMVGLVTAYCYFKNK